MAREDLSSISPQLGQTVHFARGELTVDVDVDAFADGWRNVIPRDTEVGTHLLSGDTRQYQRLPDHLAHLGRKGNCQY